MLLNHQYCCKSNEEMNEQTVLLSYALISIPNEMRDELTFSADDNELIPESPTLFPVKNKS